VREIISMGRCEVSRGDVSTDPMRLCQARPYFYTLCFEPRNAYVDSHQSREPLWCVRCEDTWHRLVHALDPDACRHSLIQEVATGVHRLSYAEVLDRAGVRAMFEIKFTKSVRNKAKANM
jgi:hypothetical protein